MLGSSVWSLSYFLRLGRVLAAALLSGMMRLLGALLLVISVGLVERNGCGAYTTGLSSSGFEVCTGVCGREADALVLRTKRL